MKTFTTFAALAATFTGYAAAIVNHTAHHVDIHAWGNSSHFTNQHTKQPMRHFANWSNGTHFSDVATNETIKHFDCDVQRGHASPSYLKLHKRLARNTEGVIGSVVARAVKGRSQVSVPMTNIPLYIHIITTTANAASFPASMGTAQAQALNKAYNPYGISFQLQQVTSTANDAWAVAAGTDMDAAKAALRQGTYGTLNLYMHSDLSGGVLGTCTLPSQVQKGTPASMYVSDGCNINAHTMPGSDMAGYNQGMTAVHETGHWLGLLHTFEGYACTGDGDGVPDTPIESVSTNGCPASPIKNSCPSVSKGDPIHNYMDYSTDACYNKFTPGQLQRISTMWTQFRAGM